MAPAVALAIVAALATLGCQGPPPHGAVVLLYGHDEAEYAPDCPEGRCLAAPIDEARCPEAPVRAVVLAGHSLPPVYLGLGPDEVADVVRCHRPEIVVLDTCYGASSPLLGALLDRGVDAEVIAAPFWIGSAGLDYGPAFFEDRPLEGRAAAVRSRSGRALFRARLGKASEAPDLDRARLDAAEREARSLPPEARASRLRRIDPPLLPVEIAPGRELLVLLDAESPP